MYRPADVRSVFGIIGDGNLVAFVDNFDGLITSGGDHVDDVVGKDEGAGGVGRARNEGVVDGKERNTLILIKVANLIHLFANFNLEVAIEDAVGKREFGADGDDIHATVGGFQALGKSGPVLDGDAVDAISGAELGGGSGHAFDGLDEDVSREGLSDLEGETTHVKTASGKGVPIDMSLIINLHRRATFYAAFKLLELSLKHRLYLIPRFRGGDLSISGRLSLLPSRGIVVEPSLSSLAADCLFFDWIGI